MNQLLCRKFTMVMALAGYPVSSQPQQSSNSETLRGGVRGDAGKDAVIGATAGGVKKDLRKLIETEHFKLAQYIDNKDTSILNQYLD